MKHQFKLIAIPKDSKKEYWMDIKTHSDKPVVSVVRYLSNLISRIDFGDVPKNQKEFMSVIKIFGIHKFNFYVEYEDGNRVPFTGIYYNKVKERK